MMPVRLVYGTLFLAALAVLPAPSSGQEAPLDRLEEIVVTASIIETPRRQIGTAVSVVTADEIELRGSPSLADVLRTQPGISVTNAGGQGKTTTLRIRGEESFRTTLVIDGVKAVDPSAPQAAPIFDHLLATGDLERVEVLRGPQGFIYGADAGGVVNVLTRRPEEGLGARIAVEGGRYGTRRYEGGVFGGNDRGDFSLFVTDYSTDGFNAQTADTELRDADGADNTTLHARLGWNTTDNLRLQLVARDIDASSMYDGCFSLVTFSTTHDCFGTFEQTTYRVSAEHQTAHLRNSVAYSNADIARDDFADGASAFATRGELSRFEYTGSYQPREALTLVYGLDLQNELVRGDERLDRNQRGYYLEYLGRFGEALHLSAGARYDDNDDFGSQTSVRLSGAYLHALPGGHVIKYRASVGTGFRPPSLYELAYNRGPFALPPAAGIELSEESSRGYDAGIEYHAANGLFVELTVFDQRIEDEIFFDLIAFSGYLQSPGTSRSQGIELGARAPIGAHWQVFGNWTHNDAEDSASERRLRRPRNLLNAGFLYEAPDDKLRLMANYRFSRDSLDIGGAALDDYAVLDFSGSYDLGRFEVYARIENVTDERYQELIGYNTSGRAAYAGLRLRF